MCSSDLGDPDGESDDSSLTARILGQFYSHSSVAAFKILRDGHALGHRQIFADRVGPVDTPGGGPDDHNYFGDQVMPIPQAQPGEVVYAGPLGPALAASKTSTLIETKNVKVVHMVVLAGKEIKDHKASGEIVVQCIEGKIAFTAMGETRDLTSGQMLYLEAAEVHSVRASEDSSFLLTILLHR